MTTSPPIDEASLRGRISIRPANEPPLCLNHGRYSFALAKRTNPLRDDSFDFNEFSSALKQEAQWRFFTTGLLRATFEGAV